MKNIIILFALLSGFSSIAFAQAPPWIWARGGDSLLTSASAASVATNAKGHSALCGMYYSPISISGHYLMSPQGYIANFYVALFDENGQTLWANRLGSVLQSHGAVTKISIDSLENIYVFGYYQDSAEFGDTAMYNPNYTSVFAAKFDSKGNRLWVKTLAAKVEPFDNNHQSTYQFAAASNGLLYIAGSFQYSADCQGNVLQASGAGMYFASYSTDGIVTKALILNGTGNCTAMYLAVEPVLHQPVVYLCGQTLPSGNLFVDQLSDIGTVAWQLAGINGYSLIEGVAASDNAVYIAGSFADSLEFNGKKIKNYSSYFDGFLLKLNTDGEVLWLNQLGGERVDQCHGVGVDHENNAYICGSYQLAATFGTFKLTDPDYLENTAFLAKYDPTGKALWAIRPVQNGDGSCDATAITGWESSAGSLIHVAGSFAGAITFGSTTLGGLTGGGFFLAAIDQNNPASVTTSPSATATLAIYPNPAHKNSIVEFHLPTDSPVEITLTDALGRVAYVLRNEFPAGQQSVTCDLTSLANGIYYCNVTAGGMVIGNTSVVIE
jgi:hypothetical protein